MNRRGDKIVEIEKYLDILKEFLPSDFDEYMSDEKTKAACERYFEKIIEAVIDLVFLIIKENSFRSPENDRDAFDILCENGVVPKKLTGSLSDAKSMRNIIIHEYGYIDDRMVFNSVRDELIKDVEKFLELVK